jgi:hypothetical protein
MAAAWSSGGDAAALRGRLIKRTDPLIDLLDRARDEAAAQTRRVRATRVGVATETATFAGLLVDLSEAGDPVVIELADGSERRARIEAVGADVLVLEPTPGQRALLAMRAIVGVDTPGKRRHAIGDREPARVTLGTLVAAYAPMRPDVVVRREHTGARLRGRLWSCGIDLCSVRTEDGRLVHVPLDALVEVVLDDPATGDDRES